MSKGPGGLFSKKASTVDSYKSYTSGVWNKITPTQDTYPGTNLPRSFKVSTKDGELWVHGHATIHMHEDITTNSSNKIRLKITNPPLYTQFILHDFQQTVNAASKSPALYDKIQEIGNWQIRVSKPRKKGQLPAITHAVFKGWK